MVMRSGGGLTTCEFSGVQPVVMAWIVPPRGARWIVAERSRGYAVAYPVTRREPINVTQLESDIRWVRAHDQARVPYVVVYKDGRVVRKHFSAYVAG